MLGQARMVVASQIPAELVRHELMARIKAFVLVQLPAFAHYAHDLVVCAIYRHRKEHPNLAAASMSRQCRKHRRVPDVCKHQDLGLEL